MIYYEMLQITLSILMIIFNEFVAGTEFILN